MIFRMDPIARFATWFEEARHPAILDRTAMSLATATPDGAPSVRMVLLKGFDARGFAFYMNLQSRKGEELGANPRAALNFYWQGLERQVRIEGPVAPVSEGEADAYFATRPRGAQIGAWASDQSRPMKERGDFERRIVELATRYDSVDVPRPPQWSGFRLNPSRMEFWTGRENRLHEREVFTREGDGPWKMELLYP